MGSPASDAAAQRRLEALERMTQGRVGELYAAAAYSAQASVEVDGSALPIRMSVEDWRSWHRTVADLCLAVEELRDRVEEPALEKRSAIDHLREIARLLPPGAELDATLAVIQRLSLARAGVDLELVVELVKLGTRHDQLEAVYRCVVLLAAQRDLARADAAQIVSYVISTLVEQVT